MPDLRQQVDAHEDLGISIEDEAKPHHRVMTAVIIASRTRERPKIQRREGKGLCLTDAARFTLTRRAVRGFCRYAIVRTSSIALNAAGSAEVVS